MTRRSVLLSLAVTALVPGQQRKPGPEIELLDVTAKLEEGRIHVDGHVKNTGDRSVRKLNIIYEMLDSDRRVLTRQQGPVEAPELAPEQECDFHAQMAKHARSVYMQLSFEDGSGRDVRSKNGKPFPIEQ
jgi:hypothetical protein